MRRLFDDVYSLLHLMLGVVASLAPLPLTLFFSLAFIVYELITSHTVYEFVGDVLEYLAGLTLGLAIRVLLVKA